MRKRLISVLLLSPLFADPAPLSLIVLNPQMSRSAAIPDGWQVKRSHGNPEVAVIKSGESSCVRLHSDSASFGLEKGVEIDPSQTPYLTWRWKVTKLPPKGDFRKSSTDDQAAQVLVAFSDRRILTYIWDSSAPKDTVQSASSLPLVHITAVVCRSGAAELNQWLTETRNVAQDYEKAFGRKPPKVKGIRLQINSQHTQTVAESYFGDVAFKSQN